MQQDLTKMSVEELQGMKSYFEAQKIVVDYQKKQNEKIAVQRLESLDAQILKVAGVLATKQ